MGTSPLWVPFALAVIAVVGTLAGVVFTQILNSRHEERRWARENERLRVTQAKEDLNRTFDHRRAAYVEFQQELDRLMNLLQASPATRALDDAIFDELSRRLTLIRIYGTPEADALALTCLTTFQRWGARPHVDDLADDAYLVAGEYLDQIRKDLGVPEWKSAHPKLAPPAISESDLARQWRA